MTHISSAGFYTSPLGVKESRTSVHDISYGIVHGQKVRQEHENRDGINRRHLYECEGGE
jgi:hypothetical protein